MKKAVYFLVLFIFTVVSVFTGFSRAEASIQRLEGMSISQDNAWMIHKDFAYINLNPAAAGMFSPLIWVGWTATGGGNTGGNGALLLEPMNALSLYIQTGSPTDSRLNSQADEGMFNTILLDLNPAAAVTPLYTSDTTNIDAVAGDLTAGPPTIDPPGHDLTNEQIRIDAAYKLSQRMVLGATLGYSQTEEKTDTEDFKRSQTRIGGGINFDLGGPWELNAAATLTLLGIDNSIETGGDTLSYTDDGAKDISINARATYKSSRSSLIHIYGLFGMPNYSTTAENTVDDTNDDFGRKGTIYKIGVCDEMEMQKDVMVFIGGYIKMTKFELDYSGSGVDEADLTSDTTSAHLLFGAEGKLSESLTGRLGLIHGVYEKVKTTSDSDNIENEDLNASSSTSVSIGASYEMAKFKFEAVVNKELFTDGPNFLSNNTIGAGLCTNFAIIYYLE